MLGRIKAMMCFEPIQLLLFLNAVELPTSADRIAITKPCLMILSMKMLASKVVTLIASKTI